VACIDHAPAIAFNFTVEEHDPAERQPSSSTLAQMM
jgi:hypothetical protein